MSKLNQEQLLAVQHSGGVLLKAGAGSGKTTVLVAHIVYLSESWMKESAGDLNRFDELVRTRYSKTVMMTFTKKAAGEMSVRLNAKLEELSLQAGEDQAKWKICLDALPLLTITTIDGFNRKLIKQGYIPKISSDVEVIFENQRIEQVREYFNLWYADHEAILEHDLREMLDREKGSLLSALTGIFTDSGLRHQWKHFELGSSHPDHLNTILHSSFFLNQLDSACAAIKRLDLPSEEECSSFEKNVKLIQKENSESIESAQTLFKINEIFLSISRLAKETAKKSTPNHVAAYEGMVELRTWVKSWFPVISDYQNHYQSKILPWLKVCKSIFDFVESKMDPNQGMTFSDVEYVVAEELIKPEVQGKIIKQFDYFIVDEFQDTSEIQFQVIRSLIGNDFRKLFCVGDPKQAIYGFRGGEVSVFQNCSQLVPTVLTLANNYRSLPKLIEFNNSLFSHILPLGREFQGNDPFPVDAEDQVIPSEIDFSEPGKIEILEANFKVSEQQDYRLTNDQVEVIEASIIADSIERARGGFPTEVNTVLYRWLKPSVALIRILMERKVGFTAQYKIKLSEEPILGMFLVLLKRGFDRNDKTKDLFPMFLLQSYMDILKSNRKIEIQDFEFFDNELKYWGLLESFKRFIFRLGITNENADINLQEIEVICTLFSQDPEDILEQLRFQDDKISLDFRYGESPEFVQIMTSHASKGLEFERVYLGGLYTNGMEVPDREMFGDAPDSFKWFINLATKEIQKSPRLVFENELRKVKNFSESKRLFYVACTRAKKTLSWVRLNQVEEYMSRPQKNSWIKALHSWEERHNNKLLKVIPLNDVELSKVNDNSKQGILPLYFYNPVGVFDKKGDGSSELALTGELSVTKLNALIDCPRKFYFANTLKMKGEEEVVHYNSSSTDEEDIVAVSSTQRGSQVHSYISRGIDENFIVHRDIYASELKAPVEWALELLGPLAKDFELISEKPLKFRFYGQMISGIPDLIVLPKESDHTAQVWDFKTGRMTEQALSHYWIQLKVYAYALYELGRVDKSQSILIKLCFVDQKKMLDQTVQFEAIEKELFVLWQLQNRPWQINPEHCSQCQYRRICCR